MKVTCRYSGVEFRTEYFNFSTDGEHPIFHLPVDRLLGVLHNYLKEGGETDETTSPSKGAKLTTTEVKLLFVALLNATDLVDFEYAARPSLEVAIKNIPAIGEFVIFRQTIPNVEILFPRVSISYHTQACENAHNWLEVWFDKKQNYIDNFRQEKLTLKLQHMEELLSKLIRSPMGDQQRKIGMLARWAMIASEAPKEKHDAWTALFKLKGLDIFKAKSEELAELVDWMERKLPAGSLFCFETLNLIRELHIRNVKAVEYGLGMSSSDFLLDPFELENNPFQIISDDTETSNRKIIAASAPLDEPKPDMYRTRLEYLQAKSAWYIGNKERVVKQAIEAAQAKYLATAALNNLEDETSVTQTREDEIADIIRNGG